MMGLPAMLYNVHYPNGVVDENVTLFGGLKKVGERIARPTGKWVVTELRLPKGGAAAFEALRDARSPHLDQAARRAARSRKFRK